MSDVVGLINHVQNAYARCIDNGHLEAWPDFFDDDCIYKITTADNYSQGLEAGVIFANSKGMLRDRVYGVRETLYHDPYYQRHIVSMPRIRSADAHEIRVETNYLVVRTKRDSFSELFNVGRYLDTIERTPEGLKFRTRECVFDSEWIRNSIIYPL